MNFHDIDHPEALKIALDQSAHGLAVFFKHSARCSISRMVENRLQRSEIALEHISCYLIEVVKSREVSNMLTELSGVKHESPQLLIFNQGKCVKSWSHNAISPEEITEALVKQTNFQG